MKPHPAANRAFTLVEVLVSLAIFALAAVALAAAYLNVLNGYQNRDHERAINATWSLVRIATSSVADRDELEAGGTIELPDRQRVTWTAQIVPTPIADLFALELSAHATAPTEWERRARIMLLRPEWSDPGERDRLRADSKQLLERNRQP
ncbi:MAG: prepilin-type N-terminal cleavage/methylation domain-containing protein [Opitutaceae bacterium]|nr:prepilin-type N-terminal cleavage/methylation domain-containing protein [Opitutaceae bacterium]